MKNETLPLSAPGKVHHNLREVELIEAAVCRGEARLSAAGALVVETGAHTGRSAQDKHTVRDATTEKAVWWDNNKPMSPEHFELLWADFREHAKSRELYVQDLFAGADPAHRLKARIFVEYAWHALFIRHLLRQPTPAELAGFVPEFTVVNLPSFKADPAKYGVRSSTVIACNFAKRLVLIGGTSYAGETKKSVFTFLNYAMPEKGVMPMHGSANVGPAGDRPTPSARCSATTSTAGPVTASTISRAAATPRPFACRRRPSPRSGPPPTASARCWRTSSSIRRRACPISTTAG
jgi:phosphoenolpyruvate carboxykinase (ATP)